MADLTMTVSVRTGAALLASGLALLSSAATADPITRWEQPVAEASVRFGIPQQWIWRVMEAESGGNPVHNGRPVRSRVGAMGLMQLMPSTWQAMRTAHGLGNNPDDPRDNILAGTAYLRRMYERFGYPGLFAAYNAGPERYAAYLGGRRGLPGETTTYVRRITSALARDTLGLPTVITPKGNKGTLLIGTPENGAATVAREPPRPSVFFALGEGLQR